MAVRSEPAAVSPDREIVISRVLDAPRELVFAAWTDPRHVTRWWGPRGFTTTTAEMDVRPGGVWRFVMHGPDGTDYPNKIVFLEVARPDRLVYQHAGEGETDDVKFHTTVTFAEQGGKTKLTLRMVFDTAEERNTVVEKYGAVEGGKQTLERLGEHLATLAPAGQQVVFTRVFDAPRELVFRAWTDPKHVARWWGPKEFTNRVGEWDARPGGGIRLDMVGPDGTAYPMGGVFHEVAAPERLVFTSTAFEDEPGNPKLEAINTVTFAEPTARRRSRCGRSSSRRRPRWPGRSPGWKRAGARAWTSSPTTWRPPTRRSSSPAPSTRRGSWCSGRGPRPGISRAGSGRSASRRSPRRTTCARAASSTTTCGRRTATRCGASGSTARSSRRNDSSSCHRSRTRRAARPGPVQLGLAARSALDGDVRRAGRPHDADDAGRPPERDRGGAQDLRGHARVHAEGLDRNAGPARRISGEELRSDFTAGGTRGPPVSREGLRRSDRVCDRLDRRSPYEIPRGKRAASKVRRSSRVTASPVITGPRLTAPAAQDRQQVQRPARLKPDVRQVTCLTALRLA